jgi:hypothetical protein
MTPQPRHRRLLALAALAASVVALATAGQAGAAARRHGTAHGPDGKPVASSYHVTPKLFGLGHSRRSASRGRGTSW